MRYAELRPSPPLRDLIECFWMIDSDGRPAPADSGVITPDGGIEVVLELGDGVTHAYREEAPSAYRQFVVGQLDQTFRVTYRGVVDLLAIRFRPAGVYRFVDAPVDELTRRLLPLGRADVVFVQSLPRSIRYRQCGRWRMIPMVLLGGLVGGAAAFVWGAISWMVFPWHHATMSSFRDQDAVSRAIVENAPRSGMYGIPTAVDSDAETRMKTGPLVLAVVQLRGFGSVGWAMARAFAIYAVSALIIAGLLVKVPALGYLARALYVCATALAGTIVCRVTDWNWHGYSPAYTLVAVADTALGWFLVGLAMAAVVHA